MRNPFHLKRALTWGLALAGVMLISAAARAGFAWISGGRAFGARLAAILATSLLAALAMVALKL